MKPEYTMYPPNEGILIPCRSAILFTMKLGPFPMYVFAPIKTEPHETAANKLWPNPDSNSERKLSALPPTNPEAIAVNVRYVGALSRTLDSAPDIQKKCHGAFKSKAAARALRISNAGTMVIKIPRNNAPTSMIGEK